MSTDEASNAGQQFPQTRWTAWVQPAQEGQPAALADLLTAYYPPLRRYLKRRWALAEERAEDLLQGFVADKVLEKKMLKSADRSKGRFRTFLLAALDHYVIDQHRMAKTERFLIDLEAVPERTGESRTAQQAFDLEWARRTLAQALKSMEAECRMKDRSDIWEVFHTRIVRPILHGEAELPYEDLVARFALKSPAAAFNLLVTGKRMFERHLRSIIGTYAPDDPAVDEELADLRQILSEAGAR